MAALVALRFRDSTPGINTIEEHQSIIQKNGRVWWGWWRKTVESTLPSDVPSQKMEIYLVNRATKCMYLASVETFVSKIPNDQLTLVPTYYNKFVDVIMGFFCLTKIVKVQYDEKIGSSFGERTIVFLGRDDDSAQDHVGSSSQATGRSSILHLSDLHFGSDYGFRLQNSKVSIGDTRQTLTDCLLADLRRLGLERDIAAVIITGDFITQGKWSDPIRTAALKEFEALRQALDIQQSQLIAIPGNHDIVRYPDDSDIQISDLAVAGQANLQHEREFRTFADELVDRNWKESLNYVTEVFIGDCCLQICALNSCTITATQWREYGYIGSGGLDAIGYLEQMPVSKPTIRFIALHHHLLPVADVEAPNSKGVTLALDASAILKASQSAGVHVALHGHQHKAKIACYSDLTMNASGEHKIFVVSNGSVGAKPERLPNGDMNTYCVFSIAGNKLHLRMREVRTNAQVGVEIFNGSLSIDPIKPREKT